MFYLFHHKTYKQLMKLLYLTSNWINYKLILAMWEKKQRAALKHYKVRVLTFNLSCFRTWYPLNPAWILVAASASMLLLLTVALLRFSLSILCKSVGGLRSELDAFGKAALPWACAERLATSLTSGSTGAGRGDVRASTPATCWRGTVLLLEELGLG